MIWTIVSAVMPWTSIILFGALAWYVRRNKTLDRTVWERTRQVRDLSARCDTLKADNYALRGQVDLIAKERERLELRLYAAQERADQAQVKAAAAAMKMEGASAQERFDAISDLLGVCQTSPDSYPVPAATNYRKA